MWEKWFKLLGFLQKVTFSLIILAITSKLMGGFFFTISTIMCQIFSRSDVSKKKGRYLSHKKDIHFFLMKNTDI